MTCPKCAGLYRADNDIDVPMLVCMTCGHRIDCTPPPKPIRTEQRDSALFCVGCGEHPPLLGRRVCKRCFNKVQSKRRLRMLWAQKEKAL